jgi:hypothetical protein
MIHIFDPKQHSCIRLIKRCREGFQGELNVFWGGRLQLLELLQLTIRPSEPMVNQKISPMSLLWCIKPLTFRLLYLKW